MRKTEHYYTFSTSQYFGVKNAVEMGDYKIDQCAGNVNGEDVIDWDDVWGHFGNYIYLGGTDLNHMSGEDLFIAGWKILK